MITLLASCVQDVDDVFDDSSSQRVEQEAERLGNLLRQPQYGWVMEYYPSSLQAYGGFVFTMKFEEEDKVAISGDLFNDPAGSYSSLYSIKKDKNISLNFDTYNPVFHYLSDPDPHAPGQYSPYGFHERLTAGEGFEGDYEFFFVSGDEHEIILKGKKTKNIIRMTPLAETSINYLSKVQTVKTATTDIPATMGLVGMVDGKELRLFYDGKFGRRFKVEYDGVQLNGVAMMPTADGMKFYSPITINGKNLQNFSYASDTYTCKDAGLTDVKLTYLANPYYLTYEDYIGSYKIAYDDISAKTVSIVAHEEGKTLLLKTPFSTKYSVLLNYDSVKGTVSIHPQAVVTNGVVDVWICSYDANSGRLTWLSYTGMESNWNGDKENFVLTFGDNGEWGTNQTTGFYYRSFDTGTQNNGQHFNEFGEYYACMYFYSLTKK